MKRTTKAQEKHTGADGAISKNALTEQELRNAMDADPHDPWGFAPKRPPTYHPPEVYQPPENAGKMLTIVALACGVFWALIIIGVVLLIRWS